VSRETPGLFVFDSAWEDLTAKGAKFGMEFFLFIALFVVIPMLSGFAGGVIAWRIMHW